MSEPLITQYCLTLLCPQALEERVVDSLLLMPEIAVFTSSHLAAHGVSHAQLSTSEQVLGLAEMTQIQALLSHADHAVVLDKLKGELFGIGVRYWMLPVVAAGVFV